MKKLVAVLVILCFAVIGCKSQSDSSSQAETKTLWEQSTLYNIMKTKKMRVCTDPGYIPFEARNKNNDLIGFDIDIARAMAASIDVEVEFVPMGFDGIIPALLTDKCDMIMAGVTITPERNLQVNFPEPYFYAGLTVLLNERVADEIKSFEDLNDPKYTVISRLGVTGQYVVEDRLPNAQIKIFEQEHEAIYELVNDRGDAFVYDLPFNASTARDYPDKLVHLEVPFTYEPLGIAIRKGDPDFLNWIDNFLRQIKGDGTYDAIYNYWINSDEWKEAIQ